MSYWCDTTLADHSVSIDSIPGRLHTAFWRHYGPKRQTAIFPFLFYVSSENGNRILNPLKWTRVSDGGELNDDTDASKITDILVAANSIEGA